MIIAIDPGPFDSAYVILGKDLKPSDKGKINNYELLETIKELSSVLIDPDIIIDEFDLAIEMVASYGMAVGEEVFETVFWIGRFYEAAQGFRRKEKIYRKDEKMNLCGTMKAKDSNIRQALIDRFGVVGTKKNPGWFYGFKADIWAAYAVGVTYYDLYLKGDKNE